MGSEMCIRDRTNAVSTRTRIGFPHHKYVADQQPTDRQFRYSNRPIRCSTQLNRYYGHYHEHPPLGLLYLPDQIHILRKKNYDSDFNSSSRAKGKVTVNFKKISRQSLREDVRMLFFAGNMRDLDHTLLGQIPMKVVPHVNVLTCLLYTSPSPRDGLLSRMPSSA